MYGVGVSVHIWFSRWYLYILGFWRNTSHHIHSIRAVGNCLDALRCVCVFTPKTTSTTTEAPCHFGREEKNIQIPFFDFHPIFIIHSLACVVAPSPPSPPPLFTTTSTSMTHPLDACRSWEHSRTQLCCRARVMNIIQITCSGQKRIDFAVKINLITESCLWVGTTPTVGVCVCVKLKSVRYS